MALDRAYEQGGGGGGGAVNSVNGQTGTVVIGINDIASLGSTLNSKQDVLSDGPFGDGDKLKLDAINLAGIARISQVAYDAIPTKDPLVLYIING